MFNNTHILYTGKCVYRLTQTDGQTNRQIGWSDGPTTLYIATCYDHVYAVYIQFLINGRFIIFLRGLPSSFNGLFVNLLFAADLFFVEIHEKTNT